MKLAAEWTDDCQGKKDYDGDILSISTRYWPASSGFYTTLDTNGNAVKVPCAVRPASASAGLILRHGDPGDPGEETLAARNFTGESFEVIAPQVEAWAQEQMDRVVAVLRAAFAE